MNDSPAEESAGLSKPDVSGPAAADDLEALRSLIVGPEQRQLRELELFLRNPEEQVQRVAGVLPEAIAIRGHDSTLANAIAPSVEKSITTLVRRNPRPLADALFPVMGPAIRKAIAHALSSMVESLNRALEHSLSFKALRWRIEGWRTGRTFSEVVLIHTLLYRVEQVFLIHRESGLLLQHAMAPSVAAQDADMVSGMLTAIRDFVRDSFGVGEQESLEALQVGDLRVWVEQGPHAVLAAVVRGEAPADFRTGLQEAIESIHLQWAEALDAFTGDAHPFDPTRPILEMCLQARFRDSSGGSSSRGARWLAATAVVLLVVLGAFWLRDRLRWTRYIERLRSEPGLVVLSTGRDSGRHVVNGLRDPLATDPDSLVQGTGLTTDNVEGRWQYYQALDPGLILRRATRILRPPDTVRLDMENGRLTAAGLASEAWLDDSRRIAGLIAGVTDYDDRQVVNADLQPVVRALEGTTLSFFKGTTRLMPGQEPLLERLIADVGRLDNWAVARRERRIRLCVTGHADSDGSPESNGPLSLARAESLRVALLDRGLRALELVAAGAGSSSPVSPGTSEEDKKRNRRVSFKVEQEAPAR